MGNVVDGHLLDQGHTLLAKQTLNLSMEALPGELVELYFSAEMNVLSQDFLRFFTHVRMIRDIFSVLLRDSTISVAFTAIPERLRRTREKPWQVGLQKSNGKTSN